jgi:hypothetical protein
MAKQQGYKTEVLADFQGGLNFRTDQFNLAANESPDLLNVSVDPRGGIKLRNGVTAINGSAESHNINGLASFFTDAGTSHIIANTGASSSNIKYSTGGNFSTLSGPTARTATSRMYGMTMNNKFYGVSGDLVSFKWDGSSGADLGVTLDGTAGNFPIGQYVTFWNNLAWVGKTREGGTYYNSRVRWSNINDPEKWANLDYVDIGLGEGGDGITGFAPLADRLLIFKANSVHAMYGFGSDSFQVTTLTTSIGSTPLSSPVVTPFGVYFWHDRRGVYLYNGESFQSVFTKLEPAIDNGRISFTNPPQLAWFENRLYLSLDMLEYYKAGTQATVRHVFVLDPSINAWTLTNVDADTLHTHKPPDGQHLLLGACNASSGTQKGRVVKFEQGNPTDAYDGSTAARIDSHFTTPWVAGKNPVERKRWGRPQIVLDAASSLSMQLDVYQDYDKASTNRIVNIDIAGRESTNTWEASSSGTGSLWNSAIWASEAAASITDIIRAPSLGNAKSVALKFNGPSQSVDWEVNGIMFTYKPRRLR